MFSLCWFALFFNFIYMLFDILIFIRPSSDGTYYGMVMSVRPGLRPSVTIFHTFLLHALRY